LGLPLAARREATGLLRKCSGVEGKLTVCMVNNKQRAARFEVAVATSYIKMQREERPPKHLVTRSGVTAQL
jgi:hypothetical protein